MEEVHVIIGYLETESNITYSGFTGNYMLHFEMVSMQECVCCCIRGAIKNI